LIGESMSLPKGIGNSFPINALSSFAGQLVLSQTSVSRSTMQTGRSKADLVNRRVEPMAAVRPVRLAKGSAKARLSDINARLAAMWTLDQLAPAKSVSQRFWI
jgi:hypothetical protein